MAKKKGNDTIKVAKRDKKLLIDLDSVKDISDINSIMRNPDKILRKAGIAQDVYEEMMYDPKIITSFSKRKRKLLKRKWEIVGKDKTQIDFITDVFENLKINNLINALSLSIPYGYAVCELIWKDENGKFTISNIKNRSQRKFGFNERGQLIYITDDGEKVAPYGKFVLARSDYDNDENPYGNALLSRCYWYWTFKKFGWKNWGYFLEKYGDPSLILKTITNDKEKRDEYLNMLDSVRSGGNIVIGKDEELNTLSASSSKSIGHQEYIREADKQIEAIFLGSSLMIDSATNGNYATSKSHSEDLEDIVESDARMIEEAITHYMIKPLLVFNYPNIDKSIKIVLVNDENEDNETTDDNNVSNNNNQNAPTTYKKKVENFSTYEDLPKNKQYIEGLSIALGLKQRKHYDILLDFKSLSDDPKKVLKGLGQYINQARNRLSDNIGYAVFMTYLFALYEVKKISEKGKFDIDIDFEPFKNEDITILPYDEARKLFNKRIPLTDEEYRELTNKAKSYAFSFAGAKSRQIAKYVQKSLLDELKETSGEKDWKKRIGKELREKFGVEPLNKGHLTNIYRTNLFTEYSKAKWDGIQKYKKVMPYLMYDAVGDNRTRPAHLALDGLVFSVDDNIWNRIYPPNGYNCRCSVIPLTKEKAKKIGIKNGKDYNGAEYKPDEGWGYNPATKVRPFIDSGSFKEERNIFTNKDYGIPTDYKTFAKREYELKKGNFKAKPKNIFTNIGDLVSIQDRTFSYKDEIIKDVLLNAYEVWLILGVNEFNTLEYRTVYILPIEDNKGNKKIIKVIIDPYNQVIEVAETKAIRSGIPLYFKKGETR